ncbi:MAG: response regulator [SAR202 cluster bacterium]|nr:response regulator [SAR202 cluster bacterium]
MAGEIDVQREIKRQLPLQGVLMLTGVSEVDTAVEAMRLGATDYVRKPFVLQELLNKVSHALAKAEREHAEAERLELERQVALERERELEERRREVDALNRLFRAHLDERADSIERWHALTEEVNRLLGQAQALKDQVEEMADPDEPPPPGSKGNLVPIRRGIDVA